MALDPVAFFIGAPDESHLGPDHSAEIVRQGIYDFTGGAEGVSHPTAMKVLPLNVPGGGVRVLPGGALLNNRYAGGDGQSYSVRNATQTEVTVPATPSTGGRTDLLVCRILDPQYEGEPPTDPNDFQYTRLELIQDVPVGTKTAAELNLGYPAIELARITQPASWNLVDEEHITRLNKLALPHEHLEQMSRPNVMGDSGFTLNSTAATGEWFPNSGGDQDIPIPDWATKAQITAHWLNIQYAANVNPYGRMWVEWGPYTGPGDRQYSTQHFQFNHHPTSGTSGGNWILSDTVSIPASMRGTVQKFVMKARYDGPDKGVSMNALSGIILEVRFLQTADQVD